MKEKNLAFRKCKITAMVMACIVLVAALLLLCPKKVEAIQEGIFTFVYPSSYVNDRLYVARCDPSAAGVVSIPSSVDDIPVVGIEPYAFNNCTNVTSIVIPDSVKHLQSAAFSGCTGLTNIVIPDTVTNVDAFTFSGCTSLKSVTLGKGVKEITQDMFSGCTSLESIVIPDNITKIGLRAFKGCTSLKSIVIPDSVTEVGAETFEGCTSLASAKIGSGQTKLSGYMFKDCTSLTEIVIPDTVTSSYGNVFSGCTGLTSVTIGKGLKAIAGSMFIDCTGLKNFIIPDTVTTIENTAFSGCTGLESITISPNLTKIGTYVFRDCTGLTSIEIPSKVTNIGRNAFEGCTGLTSIVIPDNVRYIDSYTFMGCTGLTSATLGSGLTNLGYGVFKDCTSLANVVIQNGAENIGEEMFMNCVALTSIDLPRSVTSIDVSAFKGCVGLTSVTTQKTVTTIKNEAFKGCTSLTSVEMNGVTTIWASAFEGCTGFSTFEIPNTVTSIDNSAFMGCTGLTKVVISSGVKGIGASAFSGCTGLAEIVIPDSVSNIGAQAFDGCTGVISTEGNLQYVGKWLIACDPSATEVSIRIDTVGIGGSAFADCVKLTSITIPDSVKYISDSAFSGCTGLTAFEVPNSVTSIGLSAFGGCTGLTSIKLPFTGNTKGGAYNVHFGYVFGTVSYSMSNSYVPSSLKTVELTDGTSIANKVFYECKGLTKIVLPDSVTSIGYSAFYNCTGLTEFIIPDGVESIGNSAFYGCTGLTGIVIPNSVTSIEGMAFYNCKGLTSVTIGNSVSTISNSVFYGCDALTNVIFAEESKLTAIGNEAFKNCTGLSTIELPNSVKSISKSAFDGCTGLIQEENGIKYVDKWVIGCDPSVTQVSLRQNTVGIGNQAFYNLKEITSIAIPDGLKIVDTYAFYKCEGLTELVIPDSVTSIGDRALYGCTGLVKITLPFVGATKDGTSNPHLGYIFGASTYSYNKSYVPSSLKTVVITGGASIGHLAFYDCSGLTSITLPNSVTSIGKYAFEGCTGLTKIVIPDSVTSIEYNAFRGCSGLTSITLPDSVTTIGNYAFEGCTGLMKIVIPDSVTSIDNDAFYNHHENFEIHGYADSYAETYASNKHIPFIAIIRGLNYTTLTATFTYEGAENPYAGLILRLTGNTDGKVYERFVEKTATTQVFGLDDYQTYTLEVVSDIGAVFAKVENVTYTDDKASVSIAADKPRVSVSLTLKKPNGEALTSGYSVSWYDAKGTILGGEATLADAVDGMVLGYEITLNGELLAGYLPLAKKEYTVSSATPTVEVTLTERSFVTVSGVVKNGETPVSGAVVSIRAKYDGEYKNLMVITKADGKYEAKVPAGSQVAVTVVHPDFEDFTVTKDVTVNTVIDGTMKSLSDKKLTLNLSEKDVTGNTKAVSFASGYEFKLFNVTKNAEITSFTLRYPVIYLPTEGVSVGDELKLTVTDKSGRFSTGETTVAYAEGENAVSLTLTERGGIAITFTSGNTANLAMLFDESGKYVDTVTLGKKDGKFENLTAGNYTVILMAKSNLLYSVPTLDTLADYGLTAGKEYVSFTAKVEDGAVSSITAEIPKFDADSIGYLDSTATLVTLNRSTTFVGQLALLRAEYKFDPEKVASPKDAVMQIVLPSEMALYMNAVSLDGEMVTDYTVSGNTVLVPLKDKTEGILRMYVLGKAKASEATVTVSVSFKNGETAMNQSVGAAKLKVTDMEWQIKRKTANTVVPMFGTTLGGATVDIYVDGVLTQTVSANEAGSFRAIINLGEASSEVITHKLSLRVTTKEDIIFYSESKEIVYDPNYIMVETLTMVNTGDNGTNTTKIDFEKPASVPPSYRYWPGKYPKFTFRVKLTTNDPAKVKDVVAITVNKQGEETVIPCLLDETSGDYIGIISYADLNDDAPVKISAAYTNVKTGERVQGLYHDVRGIIDPSGYVYEGVASNRVDGVTTTVYQKLKEYNELTDTWSERIVKWNAEEYDQMNPLVTDKNGYYEWFVPEGLWQVEYKKDGYKTVYSEWLPVPPPQTDVNIGMISTASPTVASVKAYSDSLVLTFSQYVYVGTVNGENVTVLMGDTPVTGTLTPLDKEASPMDGKLSFASKFRFTPSGETTLAGTVTVKANGVVNYAGTIMQAEYVGSATVETYVGNVQAEENKKADFGKEITLEIGLDVAEAGKTILVSSDSEGIVRVLTDTVTTDANGKATVKLQTLLPGDAEITYTVKDTDVEGTTKVEVGGISSAMAGDINGDEKINVNDLVRLSQHIAGWDVEVEEATLDVNGDGKINVSDLVRLSQFLAGWDVEIF